MSQIATFFNPVALPAVAGATALESSALAPGESFAATLLNVNALLGIADPNAPAPLDASPNAELLGSLLAPVAPTQTVGDAIQIQGFEASLAAQFAVLQNIAIETAPLPTPAAPQTISPPAVAPNAVAPFAGAADAATKSNAAGASVSAAIASPELRGSFAAEAETTAQTPSPQPADAKSVPAAAIVAAAKELAAAFKAPSATTDQINNAAEPAKHPAPEVAAAPATQARPAAPAIPATPATPASATASAGPAKRATPATPASPATPAAQAPAGDPSQVQTSQVKPVDAPSQSAVPALTGDAQNPATDQGQQTSNGSTSATAPTPSAAAAPPLPATIAAQQFHTALIATPQTAVPLDALAVNIARKFEQGASEFEISLHPADLGKLDIKLTVSEDGRVQAALRAERPETLELLQRDSRSLEQQLRNAGLDVGANALSFSLSNGQNQRQTPNPLWPDFAGNGDAATVAPELAISNYAAVRVRDGIDIRV